MSSRSARPKPKPQRWEDLTAGDLMRKSLVTVDSTASLAEVEKTLADEGVGGAPVVDEAGRIVGVVSMRDLVERLSTEDTRKPRRPRDFYGLTTDERIDEDLESFEVPEDAEDTAADVMTGEVLSVPADARLPRIAREMTKHKVHRLLVTQDRRYVGIVSTKDILAALAK